VKTCEPNYSRFFYPKPKAIAPNNFIKNFTIMRIRFIQNSVRWIEIKLPNITSAWKIKVLIKSVKLLL